MTSRFMRPSVSGVIVLLAAIVGACTTELPPPGSKPLSAVLKSVEEQGLGVVTRAELDDGWWEIKVCKGRDCHELDIDPRSGEERRRRKGDSEDRLPPADAKPLSSIIQGLEARNLGVITEVEFDDGFWEVELRQDGRRVKLDIDPRTGEIRR